MPTTLGELCPFPVCRESGGLERGAAARQPERQQHEPHTCPFWSPGDQPSSSIGRWRHVPASHASAHNVDVTERFGLRTLAKALHGFGTGALRPGRLKKMLVMC